MLEPKRIIKNGIATIVFWNDGTKTIVKCAEDDEPDDYMAFCAAYCKKVFGSNSHLKRVIKDAENAKRVKTFLDKSVADYNKRIRDWYCDELSRIMRLSAKNNPVNFNETYTILF